MSVIVVLELGKRLLVHKHGSVRFCTYVRWVLKKPLEPSGGKKKKSELIRKCLPVLCPAHKVRPGDIKVVGALGDSITVRRDTPVHKLKEI